MSTCMLEERARARAEREAAIATHLGVEVDGGVIVSACMLEEPRLALRANPRSSGTIRGNQPNAHLCEPWFPHTPQVVHAPRRADVVVRCKGLDTLAADERICLEDEHSLCSRLRHTVAT